MGSNQGAPSEAPQCTNGMKKHQDPSQKKRRTMSKLLQDLKLKLTSLMVIFTLFALLSASGILAQQSSTSTSSDSSPANHRMDEEEAQPSGAAIKTASPNSNQSSQSHRQSRQYEPMGAQTIQSNAANYGSLASAPSDSSAAAAALASAYLASSAAGSSGGSPGEMGSYSMPAASMSGYQTDLPHYARAGYPTNSQMSPYGPPHMPSGPFSSVFPMSGLAGPTGGLFSSSQNGFPLMAAKGFELTEIVCTAIAVAIGAVIVGAPFLLLYLFIMNHVQGGQGPGGLGGPTSGGSISLTGPSASTNVSGRKKRQTSFPEVLLKQLSPFINNEQVAQSFKMLLSSLAKYQQ